MNRKCIICGLEISKCMGFVLARDWLKLKNGKTEVREICGKCVLKITFKELKYYCNNK